MNCAMRCADQLVTVARAYAKARELSISRVSTLVFNEGKKLDLIINGADLHTARFESAMEWFSANWPPKAAWPRGVDRPRVQARAS